MSILTTDDSDPVGAAALLGHADADAAERARSLEDAMWSDTTLRSAVVESIRLRSAMVRGCEFCSAVRISAGTDDGLSEAQITLLGNSTERSGFSADQRAALDLVDRFLLNPRAPSDCEAAEIGSALGTRGVVEVLVACCLLSTAELRIALGENHPPTTGNVIKRIRGLTAHRSSTTKWPRLSSSPLSPGGTIPHVAPSLAGPVKELVEGLWSGTHLQPDLVAACTLRSSQLLGVQSDDPVFTLVVPPRAASRVDSPHVRDWPHWPAGEQRDVLALAEQIWIDPAGVNSTLTDPLAAVIGVKNVILVAWDLIWVRQLQRLALVLHG